MATLYADFRARFPEFSTISSSRVEDAMAEATAHYSASDRGILLLTAHLLALKDSSVAGEIDSVSLGGQSVSATPQSETGRDTFYTSTSYGKRFLALKKAGTGGNVRAI